MKPARVPSKSKPVAPLLKDDYWAAFQYAELAVSLLDLDLAILDVNEIQCRLFSRSKEELLGKKFGELFAPDSNDFISRLGQATERSEPVSFNAEAITPQGARFRVSVSGREIDTTGGKRILACLRKVSQPDERPSKVNGSAETGFADFSRRLDDLRQQIYLLQQQRAESSPQQRELLTEAFESLQIALEELEVADEELRQQYQEVIESQQDREAERQRYIELFEYAPDGYLVTDAWGKIREANRASARLLNVPQKSLPGRLLINFIDKKSRRLFRSEIINPGGEESVREWELLLRPRDGEPFISAVRVATSRDSEGKPTSLRWLLRDITEKKQAEEALNRSRDELEKRVEERTADLVELNEELRLEIAERKRAESTLRESRKQLASIIGSAMDAIITVDEDQRIVLFNAAAEEMFRCSADMAIGLPLDQFIPARFRKSHQEHIRAFGETNTTSRSMGSLGAISGLRADGEEFPIEASISQVEVGSRRWFTVIIRDITQRRQAESRLREQAALLDQTTDAIIVQDMDEHILFWSKGAERIYGWNAQEAVGKHINELHYKGGDDSFYEARRILLEEGKFAGEARHTNRGGKKIIVHVSWTLLRDEEGNPKSILAINTDITEQKRLESQFFRAQRMESIGTLAGGIAHDLNNVLSPILMAIRLLQMKFTDAESRDLLSMLEGAAERGAGLIKQVLSFARGLEGERLLLQTRHLIKEVIRILRDTLPKSMEIKYVIAEDLWPVVGDATQIHQVMMNLCINARDAMPQGGRMTIEANNIWIDESYARMNIEAKPGHYACITIRDTGTGIPAEIIDKIFDPFFTTKEQGEGTGLGLATVLTIVKSHGGFINVYSEEGRGTEIKVHLPADDSQAVREADAAIPELPTGHGELILVVDDEAAIREITKSTLEAYGYRVLAAGDGTEAVALGAQYKDEIKVLLTDVMMPFMDGPATIRAVQKLNPKIKLIVSSGLKENARVVEARSLGVKVFLSKPYTADKLLMAIADLLNAG